MPDLEEIKRLLASGSAPSVRKAAKHISKHKLSAFGETLLQELTKILSNPKLWETQVELIKALGIIDYKPALDEIAKVCTANKEQDMVTYSAATAYVRLKRKGSERCRAGV